MSAFFCCICDALAFGFFFFDFFDFFEALDCPSTDLEDLAFLVVEAERFIVTSATATVASTTSSPGGCDRGAANPSLIVLLVRSMRR